MDKSELQERLTELANKNRWTGWNVNNLRDGRVSFRVRRLARPDEEEILFDNYERFTEFVCELVVAS